jgi:hypothetical protein
VRRVNTLPVIAILTMLIAAACGGASGPTDPPAQSFAIVTLPPATADPFPTEPPIEPPLETPAPEDTPAPLDTPAPEDTPAPLDTPAPEDTPVPLETPPPGTSQPATACSANADEVSFYSAVVAKVSWAVYCPGLPAAWHIVTGSYRTTGSGRLEIGYKTRAGSQLSLAEGAFCTTGDGCVPAGSDVGAAAFGDMAGTLIAGSDGSFAIVVDRGAAISWVLIGRSIDEATFRDLAANMIRVGP